VTKTLQLYETILVRHGVVSSLFALCLQFLFYIQMLVGAAATGKTTCYRTLANALNSLHTSPQQSESFPGVKYYVLNPQSITIGELYGQFHAISHEWTDGLLATLARKVIDDSDQRKWIVFDGPVDPLW
jgi:dynein heavy chain